MPTINKLRELYKSGQFKSPEELADFYKIDVKYVRKAIEKKPRKAREQKTISEIHSLDDYLRYLKELAYNPKSLGKDRELYAKLLGWLTEKREETHKFEFTPTDYTRIARETINRLREEYQRLGGSCPICGFTKALCEPSHSHSEPEQSEGGEVAAVAVPD